MEPSRRVSWEAMNTTHNTEERLNALTHTFGSGLSAAALVYLLFAADSRLSQIAFLIYGVCQLLLYLSSAATHQFTDRPAFHKVARIFDQCGVYLLIAGTYTPVALLVLPGPSGLVMLISIWALALAGILLKSLFFQGKHLVTDLLYLPMGWLLLFFLGPFQTHAPQGLGTYVLIGGLFYTVGILFYISKRIPFSHVIWHLFVLAGSISFFAAFAIFLV